MKRTREIHHIWEEWNTIPEQIKQDGFMKKSLVGKWHYHYKNKNGEIGLIKIQVPQFRMRWPPKKISMKRGIPTVYMWEACGILEFQRFRTKKQAEVAIYKALKEKPIV